ncbi:bifunctional aminoglycoside phosphotransferase/ATP-binding protein [Noviherbaspirillum sp.]|jgi:hypothetical protein|uniref:bifunctional aminoglycoside phosphotransferase/ATP-binding protein n=1 Tax=Noviherbaspirillum sp. TaxID=1926288 RepID=UPI0025FE5E57|nr:bifunctional aminoglycoside phosphotransferase/ATP-binding protein [Noviherbaspirillum sp.]
MTDHVALANQSALISALAASLSKQSTRFASFETHISHVLVADDDAYKFKKAVRFDFLDFSTLDARRFYCEEELRLNKRLAPDIYLEVVAVTLEHGKPAFGGAGTPVEYAVRMRAFEQEALWDERLRKGRLTGEEVDALAELLAHFHQAAAIAPVSSPWAGKEALDAVADETLNQIAASVQDELDKEKAARLLRWEAQQRIRLSDAFAERKSRGMIRECHGDLHSGNILTRDGRVEAFDCIEFSDRLRWIDVMNDMVFVCMDLRFRQDPELAARFLNRYLEATGDYHGLAVMRYYEVHRALIRCKVALLRAAQEDVDKEELRARRQQGRDYLAFACARIAPVRPAIMITHGFSGCGKSTVARQLVEACDAIQLRSDVERKRMRGLAPSTRGEAGLYERSVTQQTYEQLAALARQVASSGARVIVDATFLKREQRMRFQRLAEELEIPFLILDIRAPESVMKSRIAEREQRNMDASDAGLAVLEAQLASHEPLTADELTQTIVIDSERALDRSTVDEIRRPLMR